MDNDSKKLFEELRTSMNKGRVVMLGLEGQPASSEPMTVQFDDRSYPRELFFYTRTDNRLMRALPDQGPRAVATFASKGQDVFATLSGKVTPVRDRETIDRFWSEGVAAWFEGKDDPSLVVLRFDVTYVELWKGDLSVKGKLKMMFGGELQRDDFQGTHTGTSL